jgi:hypothetical protein
MDTWSRFLPKHEVVLLDYSNMRGYLGRDTYDEMLWSDFPLQQQSDALKAAVLERHGGAWFDADTVVTSERAEKILESKGGFSLIGMHIGFALERSKGVIMPGQKAPP